MFATPISITGFLTVDPVVRGGGSCTVIRLEAGECYKNQAGDWVKGKPLFIDVVVFNSLARKVAERLGKGDKAVVIGRLQSNEYTAADGTTRSTLQIVAESVGLDLGYSCGRVTPPAQKSSAPAEHTSASAEPSAPAPTATSAASSSRPSNDDAWAVSASTGPSGPASSAAPAGAPAVAVAADPVADPPPF